MGDRVGDAISGLRGPPNELALLGASNYMSEVLRHGGHAKPQLFSMDASPSFVAGRGKPLTGPAERASSSPQSEQSSSAALVDALHQSATAFAASVPVHVHDLKEVARAHTQELVDREREVRAAASK